MKFFKELRIRKPDIYLNCAKRTSIETISEILIKFEKLIKSDRPDAIFVLGDTNSAFASLSAKNKVPIFILRLVTDVLIIMFQRKLIENCRPYIGF